MLYRVKIKSACGRGVDAFTISTNSARKVRNWGRRNREHYPSNTIVIQTKVGAVWRDYALLGEF